ncbi:hypothetical protein THAOC_19483, partial [Thalassiosira oceanica]
MQQQHGLGAGAWVDRALRENGKRTALEKGVRRREKKATATVFGLLTCCTMPSQGELIIEWDDVLCRPIYRRRCRLGSKFEADKKAAGGVTKVLMNGKRQPRRQAGTVSLSPPEVSAALLEECHDDHASDGSALLSASQHPDRFH